MSKPMAKLIRIGKEDTHRRVRGTHNIIRIRSRTKWRRIHMRMKHKETNKKFTYKNVRKP